MKTKYKLTTLDIEMPASMPIKLTTENQRKADFLYYELGGVQKDIYKSEDPIYIIR